MAALSRGATLSDVMAETALLLLLGDGGENPVALLLVWLFFFAISDNPVPTCHLLIPSSAGCGTVGLKEFFVTLLKI